MKGPSPESLSPRSSPASSVDEELPESLDAVELQALLKSALHAPDGQEAPHLLRGVQHRIRRRSGGRFFGDGWSAVDAPRSLFLGTSALLLILALAAVLLLRPWGLRPWP